MEQTNHINVLGASGHAKVIIEIAEQLNININQVFDGNPDVTELMGYAVIQQQALNNDNAISLVLAIGNNNVRQKIANTYSEANFATLIHPKVNCSKRAMIGNGTVVMAGVSINADVQIGEHCIINTNASVDHDCVIESYAHISPNVGLAGNVLVGEGTHVGIGAQVIQGIKIGKWATIGAGAVIIKDVPDYAVVVGNPGKIIKYNNH